MSLMSVYSVVAIEAKIKPNILKNIIVKFVFDRNRCTFGINPFKNITISCAGIKMYRKITPPSKQANVFNAFKKCYSQYSYIQDHTDFYRVFYEVNLIFLL